MLQNRMIWTGVGVVLGASGATAVADIERGGPYGIPYMLELAINAESWDSLGDPSNTVLEFNLSELLVGGDGLIMTVEALEWDLTIETVGGSWLSEASLALRSADGSSGQAILAPGAGTDFPGLGTFQSPGIVALDPGEVFSLPLGTLEIEFFESFDDANDAVDAFVSGTITVHGFAIPAPASGAVFGVALASGLRRRRR
ncbi:MAG: hypothetical protein ACIARR_08565 [Phycisphaerales bacterium JB059]